MSTDTPDTTTTQGLDLVLDLEEGDTVEIATSLEAYNAPFTVTDTSPVVEWRVPHSEDWTTRELELQDATNSTYYLTYNASLPRCRLYSAKRGATGEPVTTIHRVTDPDSESEPDEVWCGICGEGPMSLQGGRIHHGHKHTGGRDLRTSPPTEGDNWSVPFDVPPGVTPGDVEAAAEDADRLYDVLVTLEWPAGDARARSHVRALCYDQDVYQELKQPEAWPTTQAAERGWQ